MRILFGPKTVISQTLQTISHSAKTVVGNCRESLIEFLPSHPIARCRREGSDKYAVNLMSIAFHVLLAFQESKSKINQSWQIFMGYISII